MWRNYINKKEANYPLEQRTCNFPLSTGLTGNLGLKEWVDSAFYPAEIDELKAGIHAQPAGGKAGSTSGSSGSSVPKAAGSDTIGEALKDVKNWQLVISALQNATKDTSTKIAAAEQQISAVQRAIKAKTDDARQYRYVMESYLAARFKKVGQLIDAYENNAKKCLTYQAALNSASKMATKLENELNVIDPGRPLVQPQVREYDNLYQAMLGNLMIGVVKDKDVIWRAAVPVNADASNFAAGSANCAVTLQKEAGDAALLNAPTVLPDQVSPPIDSVSHSLTFIINYGANVTPSWSLLQWKGPGNNGSFLSATNLRTHSLILALAPRTGSPAIGPDALRLIQNQTIRSLNGQ
jgi:hypothetical protein